MKVKGLIVILILAAAISCHKGSDNHPPVHSPSFVDLKLKDINIRNLPSPYYHFEYRDDKHISNFDFSSGLRTYAMMYTGDDLTLMKSTTFNSGNDSIQYIYTNGKPTSIHIAKEDGLLYRRAFLTYYANGQLKELEWEIKPDKQSFTKEQSFTFTYYPDGNVKDITQHDFAVGPQTDVTFTDRYENYDDKKNVDGFSLVHTSQFKQPILLPGITLQVNNARRIVRTSDGTALTYEENNTYTYDSNGRPLVKSGDFVYTNGSDAGRHFDLQTTYSYYD
jgi:hypothetical protein